MKSQNDNDKKWSYRINIEEDPTINTSEERKVNVNGNFASMKYLVTSIKQLRAEYETTIKIQHDKRKKGNVWCIFAKWI
jgi:hypothetical protein